MNKLTLGVVEARFADIVWENAPITTSNLIKICEKELNWKRTTTYTVLKRLCDGNIFCNSNGTVVALVSKEDFYSQQGEKLVNEAFEGSLPAFVAAFTSRKKLSKDEVMQLQKLIDDYREENKL